MKFKRCYNNILIDKIIDEYNKGSTIMSLSKKHNINYSTLWNRINKMERGTLIRRTLVCAMLKILLVSAPDFVANRKKAVSIPNMKTMLIKATKAYSFVTTPYSALLKTLIV